MIINHTSTPPGIFVDISDSSHNLWDFFPPFYYVLMVEVLGDAMKTFAVQFSSSVDADESCRE